MSTYNRLTHLASRNDYAVMTGGGEVFSGDKYNPYNVLIGQIVVFNPDTGLSLSTGDLATASKITVAVGLGPKGKKGLAKELKYLGGDHFDLTCCPEMEARIASPNCSVPQVVDLYFDCVDFTTPYSFGVFLDDSLVRSRYNTNERAKYIFTTNAANETCNDCNPTLACSTILDQFIDQINGNYSDNPLEVVRFFHADLDDVYQPFRAAKLFDATDSVQSFCINPIADGSCDECTQFNAITGVKVDGDETTFTFTVDPGDSNYTLPEQMDRVVRLINDAVFAANGGGAHLSKGVGKCCPYCIEVSSSETVLLVTPGGDVAASTTENPFDAADVTAAALTCGLRLYVDPISVDCMCDLPPNDPILNYFGRTINIEETGDGWVSGKFLSKEITAQQLPEGLGYYYQDQERYDHRGGSGRNRRGYNRLVGQIPYPDQFSRDTNTHIVCDESYCVWSITSVHTAAIKGTSTSLKRNSSANWMLIPERDSVTRASWESYIAALQSRGVLAAGDLTCSATIAVEALSVTPATVTLDSSVPETQQITLAWTPTDVTNTDVTYVSSDPTKATVSATGLITSVAAGSTTITVTSDDGGFTDTVVVTVT